MQSDMQSEPVAMEVMIIGGACFAMGYAARAFLSLRRRNRGRQLWAHWR